jgi:hypothetical protein
MKFARKTREIIVKSCKKIEEREQKRETVAVGGSRY